MLRFCFLLVFLLLFGVSASIANADNSVTIPAERAKQLYNEHCFVCHYAGGAGSPKVGDEKAWNPRIKAGKDTLLKNTLKGINFMPAKGLCTTCTQDELSAIIDYMLAQCPKCEKLPVKKGSDTKTIKK